MPPSVAINGGRFTIAIQNPCQSPMTKPDSRQTISVNQTGCLQLYIMTPAIAPTTATTEPTDKSIFPVRIGSSIPIARIRT